MSTYESGSKALDEEDVPFYDSRMLEASEAAEGQMVRDRIIPEESSQGFNPEQQAMYDDLIDYYMDHPPEKLSPEGHS
jgi:hypothetical protein